MSTLERLYQIDQILSGRTFVPRLELQEKLGISWATLKRDLAYLKDRLHAPIVFDRDLGGYRIEKNISQIGPQYELPGLWFSADEIHALLTMQHLLANLDPAGLLGPHIQPLMARLTGLLGAADNPIEEVQKRIRIESVGARHYELEHFQAVGSALIRRKRLIIRYHARGTNETSEREVSPQRLVHYRENWYLDAWCHLRDGLRAFSVDAIDYAEILDSKAKDVSEKELNNVLGSGYGIFSGSNVKWAVLQFNAARARWVSVEKWHPAQQGNTLADGSFKLTLPYSDDRELLMDILRYGADCRVISPPELASRVAQEAKALLAQYQGE